MESMHLEQSEQLILNCKEVLSASHDVFRRNDLQLGALIDKARLQMNDGRIADANRTLDQLQLLSDVVAESGSNGREHQLTLIKGIITLLRAIQALTARLQAHGIGESAGLDNSVLDIIRYLDPDLGQVNSE